MNRRTTSLAAVALLAMSPVLAACGSSSTTANSSSGSAASLLGTNNAGSGAVSNPSNSAYPTVKLMVGGWDKQIYLPYVLAQQLGMYQKYHVNVQLSTEQNGGVGAEDAMSSGQVDMAGAWYEHTIAYQDHNVAVEGLIQLAGAPGERIMCSPQSGVKSPADIKGKKMGVTDLGSGTDVLTQYIAAKAGIQRSQYTTVAVGAGATAVAALQKSQVDCVMTTQPTVLALEKQGIATSTINLATTQGATAAIGAAWPAASVLARTEWVNSHKAEAQAVVDALLATMEWMHTHTAADVANVLPQSFVQNALTTKADYVAALTQDYDQFIWNGLMPAGGPESVLQSLTLTKQAKGGEDLSKTYTNEFVNAAAKVVTP